MPSTQSAVLFFDIDGTLLIPARDFTAEQRARERGETSGIDAPRPKPAPTPAIQDAFRRLHNNGHITVLSTGRPACFIQQSLLDLGFDGLICQAGAYVELQGKVLCKSLIPAHALLQAARIMRDAGLDVDYESNEESVSLYPEHPAVLRNQPLVRTVDEFAPYVAKHGFSKFCLRGDQRAALEPVLPWLLEHFETADMGQGIREFTVPGVNKRAGIERVLAALGRGREDTFAFGDSENDLPMAEAVETFVAMGNAFDVVRAQADYVTDTVQEDGVATALEHFGLI